LLGDAADCAGRFPLLIKLLDAQDTLSLQVHPPASVAPELGGEPKTEMWYIADAQPDAGLFVGLKQGVDRARLRARHRGWHRGGVRAPRAGEMGDAMFLPSGRLHAIGAGLVIFEIQQNSDTTYRVFDWNRVGLDGKPRELHVAQSLASIDFNDFEPPPITSAYSRNPSFKLRYIVDHPLFTVNGCQVKRAGASTSAAPARRSSGCYADAWCCRARGRKSASPPGQFVLLPACLERTAVVAETQVEFLQAEPGATG